MNRRLRNAAKLAWLCVFFGGLGFSILALVYGFGLAAWSLAGLLVSGWFATACVFGALVVWSVLAAL